MRPPGCLAIRFPSGILETTVLRAMAQQFPTTAQIIYDAIVADAGLSPLIGTYEFEGTPGTLPAISIVTPGQDLPSTKRIQGLEVICHDVGYSTPMNYLTKDAAYVMTQFAVFVMGWEPSTGQHLQDFIDLMLQKFQGSYTEFVTTTPDGLTAYTQAKIVIQSHMPYDAAV